MTFQMPLGVANEIESCEVQGTNYEKEECPIAFFSLFIVPIIFGLLILGVLLSGKIGGR